MSQTLGRWLRPDPYNGSYDLANPQSLNRYSYMMNMPMKLLNPLGLEDCTDFDAAGNCVVNSGPPDGGGGGGSSAGGGGVPAPGGSNNPSSCPAGQVCTTVVVTAQPDPPPDLEMSPPMYYGLAPSKPSVLNCASGFAQRTSLAGGLNRFGIGSNGGTGGFLTNVLAGNAVSGFVNLFTGKGSMADVAFGGTRGGMPGGATGLNNGISGTLQDSVAVGANAAVNSGAEMTTALGGTVSTAAFTGAEYATAVGWAKFGYDAATYTGGVLGCAAGIIH